MADERKKPARPNIVGIDLLSDVELEALRQEADEAAKADLKAKARKEALEHFRKEKAARIDPDQELVEYLVDLPGFADSLTIDGIKYFQGQVYKLTRAQYASVSELVQNAWRHEKTVGGANANEYRKPSMRSLSGGQSAGYLKV